MSRRSICSVIALVTTVALAGCGDSDPRWARVEAGDLARKACDAELKEMFKAANGARPDVHEYMVRYEVEDLTNKHFEMTLPVSISQKMWHCYITVDRGKVLSTSVK